MRRGWDGARRSIRAAIRSQKLPRFRRRWPRRPNSARPRTRDIRFLMRELAHRSKNQMAVIAAMAKQTARGASDIPSYVAALERTHHGTGTVHRPAVGPWPGRRDAVGSGRPAIGAVPAARGEPAHACGARYQDQSCRARRFWAWRCMSWPPMPRAMVPLPSPMAGWKLHWKTNGETLSMRWREYLGRELVLGEGTGFGTVVLRTMVGGRPGRTGGARNSPRWRRVDL